MPNIGITASNSGRKTCIRPFFQEFVPIFSLPSNSRMTREYAGGLERKWGTIYVNAEGVYF